MKPWILHPSPTGSVLHVVSEWAPREDSGGLDFIPLCSLWDRFPWVGDRIVMTDDLEGGDHSPVCARCADRVQHHVLWMAQFAGILIKHKHGNRKGRAR